jgi:hypothetical protein
MTPRKLTPELLDLLPPDDPGAVASRRDLVRINWVMRQHGAMARALSAFPAPAILADLGGGDGRFLLGVAKRLAKRWPGVRAVIADRQNIVADQTRAGFAKMGWTCENLTGDIFETLPRLAPDIVIANLFLHHFEDAALARLFGTVAAQARGFVACEPRRNGFALLASRLVGVLGCNAVTRHDAVVSVEAGFKNHELSALWPSGWKTAEHIAYPFTHLFAAHV